MKRTTAGTSAAVRRRVRDLLERSPAYRSLPAAKRRQIANDTVRVASYLVDPDRLVSREFASPVLVSNDLVSAVNFPEFVSGLIDGVFGAVVNASIQQMEAYAKLIAHAASSVSDFVREKITGDVARTKLASSFPQVFCKSPKGTLKLASGARLDRSTSAHLARTLGLRRPWPSVGSPDGLRMLVTAMRCHVARERQKSFALALLMGINRVVVTDGRISARPAR
ncbi:MAG TPA: hypothetical protein PLE54_18065 [Burkholderiaceae bacterium]|nr:hypothetical protein [Burkholderiaceae bacterium]